MIKTCVFSRCAYRTVKLWIKIVGLARLLNTQRALRAEQRETPKALIASRAGLHMLTRAVCLACPSWSCCSCPVAGIQACRGSTGTMLKGFLPHMTCYIFKRHSLYNRMRSAFRLLIALGLEPSSISTTFRLGGPDPYLDLLMSLSTGSCREKRCSSWIQSLPC